MRSFDSDATDTTLTQLLRRIRLRRVSSADVISQLGCFRGCERWDHIWEVVPDSLHFPSALHRTNLTRYPPVSMLDVTSHYRSRTPPPASSPNLNHGALPAPRNPLKLVTSLMDFQPPIAYPTSTTASSRRGDEPPTGRGRPLLRSVPSSPGRVRAAAPSAKARETSTGRSRAISFNSPLSPLTFASSSGYGFTVESPLERAERVEQLRSAVTTSSTPDLTLNSSSKSFRSSSSKRDESERGELPWPISRSRVANPSNAIRGGGHHRKWASITGLPSQELSGIKGIVSKPASRAQMPSSAVATRPPIQIDAFAPSRRSFTSPSSSLQRRSTVGSLPSCSVDSTTTTILPSDPTVAKIEAKDSRPRRPSLMTSTTAEPRLDPIQAHRFEQVHAVDEEGVSETMCSPLSERLRALSLAGIVKPPVGSGVAVGLRQQKSHLGHSATEQTPGNHAVDIDNPARIPPSPRQSIARTSSWSKNSRNKRRPSPPLQRATLDLASLSPTWPEGGFKESDEDGDDDGDDGRTKDRDESEIEVFLGMDDV